VLIWKAFQNTEKWHFSFWIIFSCFRDNDIFLWCKLDQWWRQTVLQRKRGKYWINDISRKIEAVFLKLGIINVHHKRNKMTPLVLLPWQLFCRWWCVNKNKNSQFCFKLKTVYPTLYIFLFCNLVVEAKTIWELQYVCFK